MLRNRWLSSTSIPICCWILHCILILGLFGLTCACMLINPTRLTPYNLLKSTHQVLNVPIWMYYRSGHWLVGKWVNPSKLIILLSILLILYIGRFVLVVASNTYSNFSWPHYRSHITLYSIYQYVVIVLVNLAYISLLGTSHPSIRFYYYLKHPKPYSVSAAPSYVGHIAAYDE